MCLSRIYTYLYLGRYIRNIYVYISPVAQCHIHCHPIPDTIYAVVVSIPEGGILPLGLELASASSAIRFSHVRYICHPMLMTPANILRYSIGTYPMLIAVTAGHSLAEFARLTGTVLRMRSQISTRLSPARNACMPKKYVLKIGVNMTWFTIIFVAMDRTNEG